MPSAKGLLTVRLTLVLAALVAAGSPALAGPKTAKVKPSKKGPAVHTALKSVPLPRARPTVVAGARASDAGARPLELRPTALAPAAPRSASAASRSAVASAAATIPLAATSSTTASSADISAVKQAIQLARRGRAGAATELQGTISDPLARKLVEWAILRGDDNDASFAR